jgi:hypothetical protein
MEVQNDTTVWEVTSPDELEDILVKGSNSTVNAFYLSHGSDEFPVLLLLLKGEHAWLNYLTKDREPGFVSTGRLMGLDPLQNTRFSISHHRADDLFVLNRQLIPFADAITAAREFLSSKDLPKSVEWFAL